MRRIRRTRRSVPLLAACLLGLAGAVPAQAAAVSETGYRYWSFWEGEDGSWVYATQGPGTARPSDGDVLGFRFAVSTGTPDAAQPRGEASFAAVCQDGDGGEGGGSGDRVAVVIDFGTAADAPDGASPPEPRSVCAPLSEGATAAEVLAEVAEPLRYSPEGLLCAVGGYPETGCAERVEVEDDGEPSGEDAGADAGEPAGSAADGGGGDGGGSGAAVAAGVAVVALLAGAALWRARARRA